MKKRLLIAALGFVLTALPYAEAAESGLATASLAENGEVSGTEALPDAADEPAVDDEPGETMPPVPTIDEIEAENYIAPADMPVIETGVDGKVKAFILYYSTRGRQDFVIWLERSAKYLPMIRKKLDEAGLPDDLAYIALIESGFNTEVRSHANAVGMWQFIAGTAKKYGMRVDWWIDERKDPIKSTDAAIAYFKDLYGLFDSWALAAAGYNAGEGKVLRGLKNYKTEDYWSLSSYKRPLRLETREYVPRFMAAFLIAKDPARYGFTELTYLPPLEYDEVVIPEQADLNSIAGAAGVRAEEIKALNPALLRWFTPPNYPNFVLKLPKGSAAAFNENFPKIPPREKLKFLAHKVKKGETLSRIAKNYGVEVQPIVSLNSLKSARNLRIGSTIIIPVRPHAASASAKPDKKASLKPRTYVVKEGDTVWEISKKFDVDVEDILYWNKLKAAEKLLPGQKLVVSYALPEKEDRKVTKN